MNPSAIYSKSGKGVQEASGKTSHLSRPDRAVLSAIDGRATLADVAQKVGKTFDPAFEKVIESLDKAGFIREVSPGTPAAKPAAGAKPAGKPAGTAPMDAVSDLDFTAALSAPGKSKPMPPPQAPPRAAPPPPKQTVTIPPAPPPPTAAEKAKAEQVAKEQQDAFTKAREEAERKAAAERERVKAEAEAKLRAETEAKVKSEAEAKAKADTEKKLAAEAEAKVKAAQQAAAKVAAEAKAKAEAEAKNAREEAERARKEAEEKARREQEELKRKLEEERKAREEAERKAKEEARRLEEERKKLEEERRRVEEERKAREEERRREEEERTQRRIQEERERVERKKREKEEEEERAARRQAKEQEEPQEEEKPKAKPKKEPEPAKAAAPGGGSFSDSLLADLESFTNQEENEAKEKAEAERKAKEEAARRAREEQERREKEEAERREKEEREAAKRREKEEAEARKRGEERALKEKEEREKERLKEEEEKRKKEAEEREKKAKQEEKLTAKATRSEGFSEEESLRKRRERQLGPTPRAEAAKERAARGGWGKPIAIVLFLLIVVGLAVVHFMPIDTSEYERAASDALGRPVKIGSARLSLVTGPQVKLSDVTIDEIKIAEVRAHPELSALTGPHKAFSLIEIDGAKLPQEVVGQALFAKVKADNFSVARVSLKKLELVGPLALPKGLEVDAFYDAQGVVRAATVRGPDALLVKMTAKEAAADVEMSASSFTVPFARDVTLSKFGMKATATPRGMSVSEWDGQLLSGTVSGTANLRWGDTWVVDGVLTARSINAAVFAPALLSDGRGEGSGKFSMRGEPAKLGSTTRLDGSFTITRGVLGTIDLSRAIQTGGKQATGRTEFNEMNGQAVYERGAVSLRNVTLSAGRLNAGASAEIAQNGTLSGRIVADVKVSSQTLRATLNLGGTLKEPQVRN